ncbi:MAG: CCA tRNA nucleotidyltransferase [Candidatus ainarchaeum sp.]|nr:CCA tRNA nucleotidyltransferase [Candidatus ainarchaeum sp.]
MADARRACRGAITKADEKRIKAVLAEALAEITPPRAETENDLAIAEEVIGRLREKIPKEVEIALVGSVAKGTQLKGDKDVDIFLLFPKSRYSRADLDTIGLPCARHAVCKGAKCSTKHAEHPYLQTVVGGVDVEIVPAFKAHSAAEGGSAADRSPFHTEYVLRRISEKGKGEVRLLKKFLKRLSVYGAEVKVEGFSGYLCELLILKCGSFQGLLEEAACWQEPAIDLEGHYPSPAQAREKFAFPPLTVVDPVDRNRNVAAAVSQTSLSKFVLAARAFLRNPQTEFFFETERKLGKKEFAEIRALAGRGAPFARALAFSAPDVVPDILWPQLRRTARILFERLEAAGFQVFDYAYWTDERKSCAIIFQLTVRELPAVEKVAGPEIQFVSGVEDFVRRHRNPLAGPWVGGNRIYSAKKRRFSRAEDLIWYIAGHPREFAIPSKIAPFLEKARPLPVSALASPKYARFAHDFVHKKHYYLELY